MSVTIHVNDEDNSEEKCFICPITVLRSRMKYFEPLLKESSNEDGEFEIEVQCDIQIFEWLMQYMLNSEEDQPIFEPVNVISILVSSDFLQMADLVDKCVAYIHKNLANIISVQSNMSYVSDNLMWKIADRFSLEEITDLKDKKDRIKSRIYERLTENLISTAPGQNIQKNAALFECAYCRKLLHTSYASEVMCISERVVYDFSGKMSAAHEKLGDWNPAKVVSGLKRKHKTWHYVFWNLWAQINVIRCRSCKQTIRCVDFMTCQFHPEKAEDGVYPCCHQKKIDYEIIHPISGCQLREHKISDNEIRRLFTANKDIIKLNKPPTSRPRSSKIVPTQLSVDSEDDASNRNSPHISSSPLQLSPRFSSRKCMKWDTSKSTRVNQDNQREDDKQRVGRLIQFLSEAQLGREQLRQCKQKALCGGLFLRLENDWRLAHQATSGARKSNKS